MEDIKELLGPIFVRIFYLTSVYFLFTVPFFLLFWVVLKKRLAHLRIQPKSRTRSRIIYNEIQNSVLTFVVVGFSSWAFEFIFLRDKSSLFYENIYDNISDYGWVYFFLSIFLLLVLDDAQFYWMHRLMHHPKLFHRFHYVHHESFDPTPFSTYAFHPGEAVIQWFGRVLILSIIPVHVGAIATWFILTSLNNILIHLGYEIYPQGLTRFWFTRWKTPSTHHNLHHEKIQGNYGLMFTWWDRWMGTEFKDYETRLAALYKRQF